jgi:ABC-2 type transport system ATP-binding protein
MQNADIIEVKNLVIAFDGFKAVDGISFGVKKGEIFGFLGANGAGKTTTIRTICGLLNPTSGEVKVNGKNISSSTAVLKPFIGYMSQKFTLYPDLNIKENMAFAGSLYDMEPEKIESRSKELFNFINLNSPTDTIVKNLSGGIKQMVSLCATLLHNPDLIFLDEPTAGASPRTRIDFWDLIKDLSKRGKTVFVTTHYMDEAEYCDRIVFMDKGKIIAFDTPLNLKKQFFEQKPLELTFKKPLQIKIKNEIERLRLGTAAVFGQKLRVNVSKAQEFKKFALEHREDFDCKESDATLEDVFLKVLAQRAQEEIK